MNRQTCYQEILLQKEGTIKSLEGQQQQQQQNGHCGGNKADEHKYDYYNFDYSKKKWASQVIQLKYWQNAWYDV